MFDNGSNAFKLCSPSDFLGDLRADMVGKCRLARRDDEPKDVYG